MLDQCSHARATREHRRLTHRVARIVAAYDVARRLKTLSGLTPCEYICKVWTSEPDRCIVDPIHQMPGLNSQGRKTSVS
ncbi:MAG: hypothetical protein EA407_01275 [Rhodobacteraceae bacterium]|nr:MAG: hypothetical protein EA407_01275 [Paracoccaceae bacterium]